MENAWYGNTRNYTDFQREMQDVAQTCRKMVVKKGYLSYKTAGNWAIFMWMTQKIPENQNQPCQYNFDDFLGEKDFSNTFVTKIIEKKKGNCLSLPLFYMCVAQELGVEAKLTLGLAHAWIRHRDEEGKWTNVELTSGQFPTDGLMMTGLGIRASAIKSGAYLNALPKKEAIAWLLTQLAQGYENKVGHLDAFTDKCAHLSIEYFPPNATAYMILKNRLIHQGRKWTINGLEHSRKSKLALQQLQIYEKKLVELGVEDFDMHSYKEWLKTINPQKNE